VILVVRPLSILGYLLYMTFLSNSPFIFFLLIFLTIYKICEVDRLNLGTFFYVSYLIPLRFKMSKLSALTIVYEEAKIIPIRDWS